jgi:hypothetical protein
MKNCIARSAKSHDGIMRRRGEKMEDNVMVYDDNVPAIADDSLLRVAEMAERRIDAVIKIKQMALKVTNAGDWVDQSGRPYLFVSGSEKIANLFNISWRIDEPSVDTEPDGHYTYTLRGVFSIPGRSISAEGSRSSKDPFFKKYDWNGGVKTEKPISAIDRRDVRMAALTNLLGNGITRLLGIRNLSYEDLEKFAGITKAMIASVDYSGKGKDKPPINEPQKKGKITEAQKKRFYAIAKGAGHSDDEIKAYLKNELSIEHTADIATDKYESVCTWAAVAVERQPGAEG